MRFNEVILEYSEAEKAEAFADGRTMKSPLTSITGDNPVFIKMFEAGDDEIAYQKNAGKELPVQEIHISNIKGTELYLNPNAVKSPSNEPPILIKYKNEYYIRDGNHRVAHSLLNGDETIAAKIADTDSPKPFKATYDLYSAEGNKIDWDSKSEGGSIIVKGTDLDDIWPYMKELEQKNVNGKTPIITSIKNRFGEEIYDD